MASTFEQAAPSRRDRSFLSHARSILRWPASWSRTYFCVAFHQVTNTRGTRAGPVQRAIGIVNRGLRSTPTTTQLPVAVLVRCVVVADHLNFKHEVVWRLPVCHS